MSISHRYFESKEARIEVVPMIDIMMFLLIFFMLIMLKMIEASGIPLKLPTSSQSEKLDPPVKRTVSVQLNGTMYYENIAMDPAKITAQLAADKKAHEKVDVVIAGDKGVQLQKLMEVMDVVRQSGLKDVAIATTASGAGS
ncbi:ExbD/TolR family protein [Parachitinimonas caeni]|uniref:Biopolymer transporter ExbD n=1 Tax=Parachitinimonas caeni TaxID=3031301 RepID=A0ABT7DWS4_9NEIS|nr:biopolymer transporter ExbD [Parachitinimonas caeni]MDK2124518.1 biopolymer transporter ExbD [Parachitinimonas caeni]